MQGTDSNYSTWNGRNPLFLLQTVTNQNGFYVPQHTCATPTGVGSLMTAYIACLLCQHRVRGKPFIIKVGESRIRTTHTPTHSGSPSHPMLQVLMHDAGVRTRALSLRVDTLKRCIDYGDHGGARTHDSSLLPRRDNPYATLTATVVIIVIIVADVASTLCRRIFFILLSNFYQNSVKVSSIFYQSSVNLPLKFLHKFLQYLSSNVTSVPVPRES